MFSYLLIYDTASMKLLALIFGLLPLILAPAVRAYEQPLTTYAKTFCLDVKGVYSTTMHCQTETKSYWFSRPKSADLNTAVGKAVLNYRKLQKPVVFVLVLETPDDCKILIDLDDKLNYLINSEQWFFIQTLGVLCVTTVATL